MFSPFDLIWYYFKTFRLKIANWSHTCLNQFIKVLVCQGFCSVFMLLKSLHILNCSYNYFFCSQIYPFDPFAISTSPLQVNKPIKAWLFVIGYKNQTWLSNWLFCWPSPSLSCAPHDESYCILLLCVSLFLSFSTSCLLVGCVKFLVLIINFLFIVLKT